MARKKGTPRPISQFGGILQECLESTGTSATELAAQIGVGKSAISNAKRSSDQIGSESVRDIIIALQPEARLAIQLGMQWIEDRGSGASSAGADVPVAFSRYVTKIIELFPDREIELKRMAVLSQWPDLEAYL